jgi:hypothetical protein
LTNSKSETTIKIEQKDSILNSRVERVSTRKKIIDSVNNSLEWKKTNFNLWKSKNGDLAIKTQEANEEGIFIDRFISELCCEGDKIKNVIDTLTFKYLGSSFYKDKNNVYTHYAMSDGGNFWIVEKADAKTFEVIGNSCYAKDKKYIYGERAMKMDSVDYKTFKTCDDCGCYAKDKNEYYFWESKIDITDITDSDEETKKIIERLKKL